MFTRRNLFAWAAALGVGAAGVVASEPVEAQPFRREDERRRAPPRHRRPPPRHRRRYHGPGYRP